MVLEKLSSPVGDSVNVGVVYMQIAVDGIVKATSPNGSISYSWNTNKTLKGSHTITVIAKDAAGNVGIASITVNK